MKGVASAIFILFMALLQVGRAGAQDFEGVIRSRMIIAPPDIVAGAAGLAPDELDFEAIFAIDVDDLLATPTGDNLFASAQVIRQTIHRSNGRTRIDVEIDGPLAALTGEQFILFEDGAPRATVVMPFAGAYMEVEPAYFAQQQNMAEMFLPTFSDADLRRFEELGPGPSTAGFETHGFEFRLADELIYRIWASPELDGTIGQVTGMLDPISQALIDRGYPMAMRAIARLPGPMAQILGNGYIYLISDVTSVEPGPVDDERFEVPIGLGRLNPVVAPILPEAP